MVGSIAGSAQPPLTSFTLLTPAAKRLRCAISHASNQGSGALLTCSRRVGPVLPPPWRGRCQLRLEQIVREQVVPRQLEPYAQSPAPQTPRARLRVARWQSEPRTNGGVKRGCDTAPPRSRDGKTGGVALESRFTWPRRLPANVDHVSSRVLHGKTLPHGRMHAFILTPIAERVWSSVEHSHDESAFPPTPE